MQECAIVRLCDCASVRVCECVHAVMCMGGWVGGWVGRCARTHVYVYVREIAVSIPYIMKL